jgi:acyl carrier protein phosphodiesterase
MNYLAHLALSPRTPDDLAGALAGDLLSGRLRDDLHGGLRRGVLLHRSIDAFADSHPAFGESRRRLLPFRHYARVIVDVFYDHLLALHFPRFHDQSLDTFAKETYALLHRADVATVPGLREMIDQMTRHDWLTGYREVVAVRRALHYLSRRFRRPVALEESVALLEEARQAFTEDFLAFYPDILGHAEKRAEELRRAGS